jgi:protein-S-isoprenylcysteine O-methyltransferase Ste14
VPRKEEETANLVSRLVAAAGSAIWLALAPGTVAGVIPWWLTGWRVAAPAPMWGMRALGVALIMAAGFVLLSAFAGFAIDGLGTPAPLAPPRKLVVRRAYKYVRNPMYLAVVSAVIGQALSLGHLSLVLYAAAAGITMAAFARGVEEPELLERFGDEYARYRRAVPGWLPRLHSWEAN